MSSKRPPVCWRCGKEGHLKWDCQQRKVADRPTGRGRRWGLKSFAVTGKGTPAVTVEGRWLPYTDACGYGLNGDIASRRLLEGNDIHQWKRVEAASEVCSSS